MKIKDLKHIIKDIAKRELCKNNNFDIYKLYFSNNKLLHFLIKALWHQSSIRFRYLYAEQGRVFEDSFSLELRKKSGMYYLGYYSRKRHFKYFIHFFQDILLSVVPISIESNKSLGLSFTANSKESLWIWKKKIKEQNKDFRHQYSDKLSKIFASFSNSNIPLQIILMDSEGDFYKFSSKLWTFYFSEELFSKLGFAYFENQSISWKLSSDLRRGFYFSVDKRIIQVSYQNIILDKTVAIPEEEFNTRKNYWLHCIEDYQKEIRKLKG